MNYIKYIYFFNKPIKSIVVKTTKCRKTYSIFIFPLILKINPDIFFYYNNVYM